MKICKIKNCDRKCIAKGYCALHWHRKHYNKIPINLPYHGNKGFRNIQWRGGVAEYPNHYIMKKNRLIILIHNPICEICNEKPAVEVHHRNGNKADHRLRNLIASCHRCNSKIRFKPNNSKYRRIYGMNLKEMANKLNFSETNIYYLHQQNRLKNLLSIKSLDKG